MPIVAGVTYSGSSQIIGDKKYDPAADMLWRCWLSGLQFVCVPTYIASGLLEATVLGQNIGGKGDGHVKDSKEGKCQEQDFHQEMLRILALHLAAQPDARQDSPRGEFPPEERPFQQSSSPHSPCTSSPQHEAMPEGIRTPESPSEVAAAMSELVPCASIQDAASRDGAWSVSHNDTHRSGMNVVLERDIHQQMLVSRFSRSTKEGRSRLGAQDQDFNQEMLRRLALHLAAQPDCSDSPRSDHAAEENGAPQNSRPSSLCISSPQHHKVHEGTRTPESPSEVADAFIKGESRHTSTDMPSRCWPSSSQGVWVPTYIVHDLIDRVVPGQHGTTKGGRNKPQFGLQEQEFYRDILLKLSLHLAAQPGTVQQSYVSDWQQQDRFAMQRQGGREVVDDSISGHGSSRANLSRGQAHMECKKGAFNPTQSCPQQQEFHQEMLRKLALHLAAQPYPLHESPPLQVKSDKVEVPLLSLQIDRPEEAPLALMWDPEEVGDDSAHCEQLIADLKPCFDAAKAAKSAQIMDWILLAACPLSLRKSGSLLVQQAVNVASMGQCVQLLDTLLHEAMELCLSPHANHVLAQLIEIVPPAQSKRVGQAIRGTATTVARHQFGSRILDSLIERCSEDQIGFLFDELLDDFEALARHQFGNFVVQHLLQHGTAARKTACVQKLLPHVLHHATHKTACNVVQRMLEHSDLRWQAKIADAFLAGEAETSLETIAATRYGSFVVQKLVDKLHPRIDAVKARVKAAHPRLVESIFSRRKIVDFLGEGFFQE
jgi:hypothetical protein